MGNKYTFKKNLTDYPLCLKRKFCEIKFLVQPLSKEIHQFNNKHIQNEKVNLNSLYCMRWLYC